MLIFCANFFKTKFNIHSVPPTLSVTTYFVKVPQEEDLFTLGGGICPVESSVNKQLLHQYNFPTVEKMLCSLQTFFFFFTQFELLSYQVKRLMPNLYNIFWPLSTKPSEYCKIILCNVCTLLTHLLKGTPFSNRYSNRYLLRTTLNPVFFKFGNFPLHYQSLQPIRMACKRGEIIYDTLVLLPIIILLDIWFLMYEGHNIFITQQKSDCTKWMTLFPIPQSFYEYSTWDGTFDEVLMI